MLTLNIPTTSNLILSCNTIFPKYTKLNPINKKPQNIIKNYPTNTNAVNKFCKINFENVTSRNLCSISTRTAATGGGGGTESEMDDGLRKILQALLWGAEGVYILWLFLLPYAPGDPVWAISSDTVNSLVGLSLNFFLILPFLNYGVKLHTIKSRLGRSFFRGIGACSMLMFTRTLQITFLSYAGIHLLEAPVLHPMSEGLFNFVIGWTFMFAPLLFTDNKRDRFKGSVDILWGFQMFLTNTFLIPYMAIRLSDSEVKDPLNKTSQLGSVMTRGAPVVGLIGAAVCVISTLWALYGRAGADANFGNIPERLEFLTSYLGSERLAYAFIWDIFLYITFQPWLIGDNLGNIKSDKVSLVNILRFVPVVGLTAYCICLNLDEEI